jgi:hypothetical protein
LQVLVFMILSSFDIRASSFAPKAAAITCAR